MVVGLMMIVVPADVSSFAIKLTIVLSKYPFDVRAQTTLSSSYLKVTQ